MKIKMKIQIRNINLMIKKQNNCKEIQLLIKQRIMKYMMNKVSKKNRIKTKKINN